MQQRGDGEGALLEHAFGGPRRSGELRGQVGSASPASRRCRGACIRAGVLCIYWREAFEGTRGQHGRAGGLEPTGKPFVVEHVHTYRVEGGGITEPSLMAGVREGVGVLHPAGQLGYPASVAADPPCCPRLDRVLRPYPTRTISKAAAFGSMSSDSADPLVPLGAGRRHGSSGSP